MSILAMSFLTGSFAIEAVRLKSKEPWIGRTQGSLQAARCE
jgi:hypothetical protein